MIPALFIWQRLSAPTRSLYGGLVLLIYTGLIKKRKIRMMWFINVTPVVLVCTFTEQMPDIFAGTRRPACRR